MTARGAPNQPSIAYGYKEVDSKGKYKLLKNKNVFPMVYVTSDTMSESEFDKLFYPYNLDTIYNRTIVNGETSNDYASKMKLIKNFRLKCFEIFIRKWCNQRINLVDESWMM